MSAYYNEFDPYAAQWLRNLIAAGHIAPGDVDDRSIEDVKATDIIGYTQCHFFAGLGGWSYALRLAGWPDTEPVWTGSCPCQPFSQAGRGEGFADARHLWPVWFRLISECRPNVVFGEQVASRDGLAWFDAVYSDLEGAGYACGAADLCAAGVGAPHIRQRLYFVADSGITTGKRNTGSIPRTETKVSEENRPQYGNSNYRPTNGGQVGGLADTEHEHGRADQPERGPERRAFDRRPSPWADIEWLPCRDGKARPTQPGLFPLAHGVSARVGRLRAYGNAIVPQVATQFIRAYCEG